MQSPKEAIKQIQALTYGAYQVSGYVAALIGASRPKNMAEALEQTAIRMDQGHNTATCPMRKLPAADPRCRPKAGAVPLERRRESGSKRVRLAPYPAEHPAASLPICSAPVVDRHRLPPAEPA